MVLDIKPLGTVGGDFHLVLLFASLCIHQSAAQQASLVDSTHNDEVFAFLHIDMLTIMFASFSYHNIFIIRMTSRLCCNLWTEPYFRKLMSAGHS